MRAVLVTGVILLLVGCAGRPVTVDACEAARAVLLPVINAALENGRSVEIETHTSLTPPLSDQDRWRAIQDFGFAPVWRSDATENALRRAYWRAWRDLPPEMRSERSTQADRRAWIAAYAQVGDDRIFPEEALWSTFFTVNRRSSRFGCMDRLASETGARLVPPSAPRAAGAVRFKPARPGLEREWALMAAQAAYPPLETGDAARQTGTIWLLRLGAGGDWRVFSARRVERPS